MKLTRKWARKLVAVAASGAAAGTAIMTSPAAAEGPSASTSVEAAPAPVAASWPERGGEGACPRPRDGDGVVIFHARRPGSVEPGPGGRGPRCLELKRAPRPGRAKDCRFIVLAGPSELGLVEGAVVAPHPLPAHAVPAPGAEPDQHQPCTALDWRPAQHA